MKSQNINGERQKKKIQDLQQFVLNRKSEDIRNELYDFLIVRVLRDHTLEDGQGLNADQIREYLEKDLKLSQCPVIHVEGALARLQLNNDISFRKNETYTLSSGKRKEIDSVAQSFSELASEVTSQLKGRIRNRVPDLSDTQITQVVENVYKLMGETFAHYGVLSAKVLGGENGTIKNLKDYPGFQEMYHRLVSASLPEKCRKEIDAEFADFFFNPSQELSRFFFAMAQSYVLIEVLNVDPELRQIQHATWSSKRIYLDTNILVEILFEGHPSNKWVSTVIESTKQIGAKMFIGSRTKEELDSWISSHKETCEKYISSSKALQEALSDKIIGDPLYATFKAEEKRTGQSFEGFCLKYENYLDILSNRFGLVLDKRTFAVLEEDGKFSALRKIVSSVTPAKGENVVQHDILSILAIREMRKSEKFDEAGPSAWFVTSDSSLYHVEMQGYGNDTIPASITIDAWLQLISPFVSPKAASDDAATAFTQLLGSSLVSTRISSRNIFDLVTVFMDDKDFTEEQYRRIIGDAHVRNSIARLKKALDGGEQGPRLAEYAKPIFDKIKSELKSDYNSKLETLQKDHENHIERVNQELIGERRKIEDQKKYHSSELEEIKKEMKSLNESLMALRAEKKIVDRKTRIYRTWIGLIIGSVIFDAVLSTVLFTFRPAIDMAVSVAAIAGAMAIEAAIIVEAPKLMEYFSKDPVVTAE